MANQNFSETLIVTADGGIHIIHKDKEKLVCGESVYCAEDLYVRSEE